MLNLLKKQEVQLSDLAKKTFEELPEMEEFISNPSSLIQTLMNHPVFRDRVLYPHLGIRSPKVVTKDEFNLLIELEKDDYPWIKRNGLGSAPIRSREDYELIRPHIGDTQIQDYIQVPHEGYSALVMTLSLDNMYLSVLDRDLLSAFIEYSSGDYFGKIEGRIPLFGPEALKEPTQREVEIMETLGIDPLQREIPDEVLEFILRKGTSEDSSLYAVMHNYNDGLRRKYALIRTVFGKPLHFEGEENWYMFQSSYTTDSLGRVVGCYMTKEQYEIKLKQEETQVPV